MQSEAKPDHFAKWVYNVRSVSEFLCCESVEKEGEFQSFLCVHQPYGDVHVYIKSGVFVGFIHDFCSDAKHKYCPIPCDEAEKIPGIYCLLLVGKMKASVLWGCFGRLLSLLISQLQWITWYWYTRPMLRRSCNWERCVEVCRSKIATLDVSI